MGVNKIKSSQTGQRLPCMYFSHTNVSALEMHSVTASECVSFLSVSGSNWDDKDCSRAGTLRLFLEGSWFTQKVETVMGQ